MLTMTHVVLFILLLMLVAVFAVLCWGVAQLIAALHDFAGPEHDEHQYTYSPEDTQ